MSHKASLACIGAFAAAATVAGINPSLSHTIVGSRIFPETLGIQHVVIVHFGRALGPGTYSLGWLVGSIDTPTNSRHFSFTVSQRRDECLASPSKRWSDACSANPRG